MKIEEYKEANNLKNLIQVLMFCQKNRISLKNITFDFLNDFEENKEDQIIELINNSNCENFKYEALFIMANKSNNPCTIEDLKGIHTIRMIFSENVKLVNKEFLYKNVNFVKKINQAITGSNSFTREQYLQCLSSKSSKLEKVNSIEKIKEVLFLQDKYFPKEAKEILKYLENIILNVKLETPSLMERKEIWLKNFGQNINESEKTKQLKIK